MSGWLPIETAPKDGTRLLLWDGRWVSAGGYVDYDCLGWVMDSDETDNASESVPTHWMPLPSPP